MPRRAIAPPAQKPPGEFLTLDLQTSHTLYLPPLWTPPQDGQISMTMHFHGALWFAVDEHRRRGLDEPLLALYPGEGSSKYRALFDEPEEFPALMKAVESALIARHAPLGSRVVTLDLSSFSAGYGAVRELLQQPDAAQRIRRIVLADSMYGSLVSKEGPRVVLPEHVEVYAPFARLAVAGDRTFALTYSSIETPTYASTREVAHALATLIGVQRDAVPAGSHAATKDPDFPLFERADAGHFHLWGYGGTTAEAHLTHPRHIAEVWLALDASGAP